MGAPDQSQKPAAPPAVGVPPQGPPPARRLKKGELLFREGENSRAMYLIKSGMVRIFKKKGEQDIEIDVIRAGQVLGELAFLDGNPRSASGEALTETEVVEINIAQFQQTLQRMPDWLKILLKTIVGRLRTASTRIRQMESASVSYVNERDGKRSAQYVYLNQSDVLKVCTATLLLGARHGTLVPGGLQLRIGLLDRYAHYIMGIPEAKITTMLDMLAQAGVLSIADDTTRVVLKEIDFLEELIVYLNEENLAEPSKRHDLSVRAFLIMSLIAKHLNRFPKDKETGIVTVNIAEIKSLESATLGKEGFRADDFNTLIGLGYLTNVNVKSNSEVLTSVNGDMFMKHYRFQRVVMAVHAINEQKRKAGSASIR